MKVTAASFDSARFRTCDAEFHRKIAALADNERLAKTLDDIVSQMLVFGTLGRKPDSRKEMMAGANQHSRLLAGLATGDSAVARRVFVTETLAHWNENFQLGLQESELTSHLLLVKA